MTLRKQIAAFVSLVFAAGTAGAQDLKSGPYKLPYKNTYVKEVFVAENEFRTAKPEHIKPRTFAEARKILPSPVWEGHEKEVEMYWHAWQIAVGNIRQPQEGSGFVSPYLDIAYNGNIFMWDASFMMMFARYGYRFSRSSARWTTSTPSSIPTGSSAVRSVPTVPTASSATIPPRRGPTCCRGSN